MRIGLQCSKSDELVIRELLSPWEVSFTPIEDADVVISRNNFAMTFDRTIVIPSDLIEFLKYTKTLNLHVLRRVGKKTIVPASSKVSLSITPQTSYVYYYNKEINQKNGLIETEFDDKRIFLSMDVISEAYHLLDLTFNSKTSMTYRLATGMPIPYNMSPKKLRDWFFRNNEGEKNPLIHERLPFDALRYSLLLAIEKLCGKKPKKRLWNGAQCAVFLTHDVETHSGLLRSRDVKATEEKYNVASTWFLPTKHYKLEKKIVRELAYHGEIGAHDTTHDGKLVYLSKRKLVERLRDSKNALERITDSAVNGFRAPLLLHSFLIAQGLKEVGYIYDSSVPTWEPKHPKTMRSHGLGSIYPVLINGLVEIPVTLIQDHQLLSVKSFSPREVINEWIAETAILKELGGCAVFLSHPEYGLLNSSGSGLALYEELLGSITADRNTWVTTPGKFLNTCSMTSPKKF